MSKLETKIIKYSNRDFKKKFGDLIFEERKSNNKINVTVSKIIQKIRDNGDDGLNYYVRKFDKIKRYYQEITPKLGWNQYKEINVKFDRQIVCK